MKENSIVMNIILRQRIVDIYNNWLYQRSKKACHWDEWSEITDETIGKSAGANERAYSSKKFWRIWKWGKTISYYDGSRRVFDV